jgi:hypothetical protein
MACSWRVKPEDEGPPTVSLSTVKNNKTARQ